MAPGLAGNEATDELVRTRAGIPQNRPGSFSEIEKKLMITAIRKKKERLVELHLENLKASSWEMISPSTRGMV